MADKTFNQVRKEVMDMARKTGMDEMDAIIILRKRLKQEGIPMPESMATDKQFKKQIMSKSKMKDGGMANGKKHMYVGGGDVTDKLPNKGLKMLAKTPKGRAAVRNMGFNV